MMDEKLRPMKKAIYAIPVLLLLAWLISLTVLPGSTSLAQTDSSTWSPPVNLSQSGGTTDPLIVRDTQGIIHVAWLDALDGFVYTRSNGESWSTPSPAEFPFDPYFPELFSDSQGNIHAFWLDEEDGLFYSRSTSANFGVGFNWESTQQIAESALAFDITLDHAGTLYLAYIRPIDGGGFPAGVYVRVSRDRGVSWSQATQLQESRYFRTLNRAMAHIEITTATADDGTDIYVVWDNPLRGRVYLARSNDGAQNWEPPYEIDRPQVATALARPFNVNVSALANQVLVAWQVGQAGVSCTHHYQVSNDRGQTWSETQRFLRQLTAGGCPREFKIIPGDGPLTLLYTNVLEDIYLSVWDGSQWSQPQYQATMRNFPDPETLTSVEYRCRKMVNLNGESLYVIGCDISFGGDIWFLQRSFGDIEAWFPPPSAWTNPSLLVGSEEPIAQGIVIADYQGKVHGLWAIHDDIIYSRWDDDRWLEPSPVLRTPNDPINSITAQIDLFGRLHVVWVTSSESLYHSWASVESASIRTEWASPSRVADASPVDNSVGLEVSVDGTIRIVYSIPINENRGVYLVQSADQGLTWSEPTLVFDAAAKGWEMITSPQIRETEGMLHAIWSPRNFSDLSRLAGLFYANSMDGGQTWSSEIAITGNPLLSAKLLAHGSRTVQLIRLDDTGDRLVPAHEATYDNGLTWIRPPGLGTIGISLGPSDVTIDLAGQLHLLQLTENIVGGIELLEWVWTGTDWQADQSVTIDPAIAQSLSSLSITVSTNGQVMGLYSVTNFDSDTPYALYYLQRRIDIPAEIPTPTPVFPTSTPPALNDTPDDEETGISATPTLDVSLLLQDAPISPTQSSQTIGLIAGSATAVLLVGVILLITWKRNSGR
jgi:hypothetical protein